MKGDKIMKNKILNGITGLNILSFFVFASGVDSNPILALSICAVNLAWLALFAYANLEAC